MSNKPEASEYQELLQAVNTEIRNYRDNIKDAQRAVRNSAGDERSMYRSVIRYNKKELRGAKTKRRFIEAQAKTTWWLWLIALIVCIIIMAVFPAAPLALIFSPLWVLILVGFIYILFAVKK